MFRTSIRGMSEMKKTAIFLAMAASTVAMGPAIATEEKAVSDSIVEIGGLPAGGYVSSSVVAFGEAPKPEPEAERRFEVGYLPSIPPRPGAKKAETKDTMTMFDDEAKPMKAGAAEDMNEGADGEKTASVTPDAQESSIVDGELDTENMELRLE